MDYIDGEGAGGRNVYIWHLLWWFTFIFSNMAGVNVRTCKVDIISFKVASISTVTMITHTVKSKFSPKNVKCDEMHV